MLEQEFDVHIIGSGIGAMTAAVLLAKIYKKRVCLLEQHWTAGGQTQTFKRKRKYEWDVGVHYIGNLQGTGLDAQISQYIFNDKLSWRPLADHYDKIRFQDAKFDVPQQGNDFKQSLIKQFPYEKTGIERYFDDIAKTQQWYHRLFASQLVPSAIAPILKGINWFGNKRAQQTLANYLERNFTSPELKNIIAARWGDYGLAPQESNFAIHALVMGSYFQGAYYPEGGSKAVAQILLEELRAHGGDCLTNVKVKRIVTDEDKVTDLEVIEHYHTPKAREMTVKIKQVSSSAGAYNTYRKLLDKPQFDALEQQGRSMGTLCLYLALDRDPSELGFTNSNYWLYPSKANGKLLNENNTFYFLSFPSLKQGQQDAHLAEVTCTVSAEKFEQWQGTTWKRRGKDYRALKQQLTDEVIDAVCQQYPQLCDAICYEELSTPLSMEFFTQHPGGSFYGVPFVPGREHLEYCQAKTPFSNLFLCGQDVVSLGFVGAMMGGAISAVVSQGNRTFPKFQAELTKRDKTKNTVEIK